MAHLLICLYRRSPGALNKTPLHCNATAHSVLFPPNNDGCPNLRHDAYVGETVNRVLESAARDFVNNRRAVSFDNGDLIVSSIYIWFRPDFGGSDNGILAHLRRYAGPTLKAKLAQRESIADHRYDWGLNGTDLDPQR